MMSENSSEFDFAPVATPEELRDALTGLATIAPDLNAATDRAAATISEIEDYLNGLHLGVAGRSEEVPFAFGVRARPDGRNEQGWMMLVYDRFCGRFAIHAVNRFDVFDEDHISAESSRHEQVAWSSLCREDKLGSIGMLPTLLLDIHHNANHALTTSRAVMDKIGTLTAVMGKDDGKTRDATTQLVANWVRSCCNLVPGAEYPIAGLFSSFRQYRDGIGDREPGGVILSANDFGDCLGRLGHPTRMVKLKVTVVTGLRPRPGQFGGGATSCWDGDGGDGDGGQSVGDGSDDFSFEVPGRAATTSGTTPLAATASPIGSLAQAIAAVDDLVTEGQHEFESATCYHSLDVSRAKYLATRGRWDSARDALKQLPPESRREYGQAMNRAKSTLEEACNIAMGRLDVAMPSVSRREENDGRSGPDAMSPRVDVANSPHAGKGEQVARVRESVFGPVI